MPKKVVYSLTFWEQSMQPKEGTQTYNDWSGISLEAGGPVPGRHYRQAPDVRNIRLTYFLILIGF